MTPTLPSVSDLSRLRDALRPLTSRAIASILGDGWQSMLDAGRSAVLLGRCQGDRAADVLVRAFVLVVPTPGKDLEAAGVPVGALVDAGLLVTDSDLVRSTVALAVVVDGDRELLMLSDPGLGLADHLEADHVLGIGGATMTLALATPRAPVGSVLDVGCGSGLQALLATRHANRVAGTDANPRAVALAQVNTGLNDLAADWRTGDLLEPFAGERFDLVVANPPFVVNPTPTALFREAGAGLDALSGRLLGSLSGALTPAGHAVALTAWAHVDGQDDRLRVGGWLYDSPEPVDAWVLRRTTQDAPDYVDTWLAQDPWPAGAEGAAAYAAARTRWMEGLAASGVTAVSTGLVVLRHGVGDIRIEDVGQTLFESYGDDLVDTLARRAWLRGVSDEDLLGSRLRLGPDVLLESTSVPAEEGWRPVNEQLRRAAGLLWTADTDEVGALLLLGCRGEQPLRVVTALVAQVTGQDAAGMEQAVVPAVRDLVDRGMLLPG